MAHTLDSITEFYFQQKQEIYSIGCEFSDLEDDLEEREFTVKDKDRIIELNNKSKEIEKEISEIEDYITKYPDEEVNPQNISFKGLKEQIMVAMIPGKYIFKKYVKQE